MRSSSAPTPLAPRLIANTIHTSMTRTRCHRDADQPAPSVDGAGSVGGGGNDGSALPAARTPKFISP
jgi:hypothetical protein